MASYTTSQLRSMTTKELRSLQKRINKEIRSRARPVTVSGDQPKKRQYSVYVLVCTGGKYYVGITAQRIETRFSQHVDGKGAKWTKIHKPLGVMESYKIGYMSESEATLYEREKTHEIIAKYGSENVRGGDLCYLDQKRVDKEMEKSFKSLSKIKAKADKLRATEQIRYQEQLASELISIIG